MAKAKDTIVSAGGVGESKIFAAPEGTFDDNPILNCHVAGVLVRDLPEAVQSRIVFRQTDEGIEQEEARILEQNGGRPAANVEIGAGPEDKALQQRRSQIKDEDYEPYMARDMMRELADKHVPKGMRPKFLSPSKVKERAGTGDWEIVKVDGQPVTYKGMLLAQMPEKRARARNRHYQEKSREMLKRNDEQFKELAGGADGAVLEK